MSYVVKLSNGICSLLLTHISCRTYCDDFAKLSFTSFTSFPILFHLLGWPLNIRKNYSSSDNEPILVSMVTRCATDNVNGWLVSNLWTVLIVTSFIFCLCLSVCSHPRTVRYTGCSGMGAHGGKLWQTLQYRSGLTCGVATHIGCMMTYYFAEMEPHGGSLSIKRIKDGKWALFTIYTAPCLSIICIIYCNIH